MVQELLEELLLDGKWQQQSVHKGKRLMTIHVHESVPGLLKGDRRVLKDALSKLVDNATQFTPSGGRVCVLLTLVNCDGTTTTDSEESGETVTIADTLGLNVRFTVVDNGPGIPPELLARVLEPFVQIEDGPTRRCVLFL